MTVYTPSVRDPFTQQVSVKIGITLERFYADLVNQTGIPVNTLYREALSRFAMDPCTPEEFLTNRQQAEANEERIQELERELSQLRSIAQPANLPLPLSYDQPAVTAEESIPEIQAAFADSRVMETFILLAKLIEKNQIDPEQAAIVNHFTALCPHIKVKRVLEAISEVGYRVEHRQVASEQGELLALFLSYHPQTTHAVSAP